VAATDARRLRALQAVRRIVAALLKFAARRNAGPVAGLVGGVLASGAAGAVNLPDDRAEAMIHVYDGGGVTASGPAFLVRKSMADRVSRSGSYYVDMVSNASIDVVTTASPFKETRNAFDLGVDYVYRDALVSVGLANSKEPDYVSNSVSFDVSQETFGGMTTVSLGYTRGVDDVSKKGTPTFDDYAKHWKYRLGLTQVLSPTWLASANFEAVSDDGFLGSPYRVARVFGAAVPERNPRTRSSRAVKFRIIGEVLPRTSAHAEYRYFWDNWDVKAHTVELGGSRTVGGAWLADAYLRLHSQNKALFYSDNATAESAYISRNRQLSTFRSVGLGAKLTYSLGRVQGKYDMKLSGGYEFIRFNYSDFTDIRTGSPYTFNANVLQLLMTANF
jgi:hypothetical protein